MDISFYELTVTPLPKALPRLLEKMYDQQKRVHIIADSDDTCKILNTSLWTYTTLGFLPHASIFDNDLSPEEQPIFLDTGAVIKNGATIVVSLTPQTHGLDVERLILMYDFHQENADQFKLLYKTVKIKNPDALLWCQNKDGTWNKS
jgi:DNA polymerase-3 subunit chi